MPYVPPHEVAKVIFPHRLALKLMTRAAGQLYVDQYLTELDEESREYALNLCGQHIPPRGIPKPQDPLFCAAMFMAGVSLGDLSMLFNIRKQTVQQKVIKHVSKIERDKLRDRPPMVDLEALALCRRIFNDALQISHEAYQDIHPLTIGRALLSAANAIIAVDRGDEPLPNRPRRYSNMNQPSGKEVAKELVEQAGPLPPAEPTPEAIPDAEPTPVSTPNVVRPEEAAWLTSLDK